MREWLQSGELLPEDRAKWTSRVKNHKPSQNQSCRVVSEEWRRCWSALELGAGLGESEARLCGVDTIAPDGTTVLI